jgi:hypothetical protein
MPSVDLIRKYIKRQTLRRNAVFATNPARRRMPRSFEKVFSEMPGEKGCRLAVKA